MIPEHWVETKLGAICVTTSGGTPSRSNNNFFKGNIPWIKSGELNDDIITSSEECITQEGIEHSSAKIFSKGTMLIALYGATIGKLGILGINAATNQAICAIVNSEAITDRLLFFYLLSQRDNFIKSGFGAAQPNISQQTIRETSIPLPPLNEQKRIVEKLDAVLPKVKATKARLEKIPPILKKFRQSILAAACSGRLTVDWRKGKDLPEWETQQLKQLLRVSSGKFLSAKMMNPSGKIPVYGGNGITGYHNETNVCEETLVIGRVGYYCGSIHLTTKEAWITDNALVVHHDTNQTAKKYLFYALKVVNLRENDSSTAQPVISGAKIYHHEIGLPPLPEQDEIIRRVEKLFSLADSLEAKYKKALVRVEKIEQAVLAKAFRGALVESDPNDEPVEELLRRVLVEREKIEGTGKARISRKKAAKLKRG